MSILAERTDVKSPTTYQEWLDCFLMMKGNRTSRDKAFAAASTGTFCGSEATAVALQKQLVETVNAVLDRSAKRFIRDVNECISFNELLQINVLFRRFKNDVNNTLFFENLFFLPQNFRTELSESVKTQMTRFWNDTVGFLHDQSLEFLNSDLEDVLFLIKRIHLF
ncbi:MAG: hypothetical protein IJA60_05625 [Clostridia bacterium]|nr:hypothetical protein [Clostridia bacterium]